MPTIVNPHDTDFHFHPRLGRLRFGVGAPLYFDLQRQVLCLDRTPTVEPTLTPLDEISFQHDTLQFSVRPSLSKRPTRYTVQSNSGFERIVIDALLAVSQHGCHLDDGDHDEIHVVARHGSPVSLILRHTSPGAERATLRIAWDADGATRIVPVDVIRTKVRSLTAHDQQVRCVSDLDDYTFDLQLPTALVSAVTQLINFVGRTVQSS
jgi:hypothetical protein